MIIILYYTLREIPEEERFNPLLSGLIDAYIFFGLIYALINKGAWI